MAEEIVLSGGNMTPVVRVGDTVRRAAGEWTPTIHQLLRHLRSAGFGFAPEPMGFDESGREILSFLPGQVATYPLSKEILSDSTLEAVARMLRNYHDATVDFQPDDKAKWQWSSHEPREVICHNDFCPYNLLWENNELVGIIDFDTASPGPRIWDMAYTAYRFVPLTDPRNPDVAYPGLAEQIRRLALFCSVYGNPEISLRQIIDTIIARLTELVTFIVESAEAGDPAQQIVLARGDTDIYQQDINYVMQHQDKFPSEQFS